MKRRPPVKLTPSEKKAWKWGYVTGLGDGIQQLELFRISVGARNVEITAPTEWAHRVSAETR